MLIVTELPNGLQHSQAHTTGDPITPGQAYAHQVRELLRQEAHKRGSAGIQTLHPAYAERTGPWLQLRVPHGFEWNRYDIPVQGLSPDLDGFRIVHLTDLHFKSFWSKTYDELANRINQASADVILISGDFVDSKTKGTDEIAFAMRLVEKLRARLGVYGILGNHDGDLAGAYLPKSGVKLLDWQKIDPAPGVQLIGAAAVHREDYNLPALESFGPKPHAGVRIVLCHYPDSIRRLAEIHPDLLLTGHTHGGQCCLPGGRAIISHDNLPKHLCKGVHRIAQTHLMVSRGLGFASLPLRVFCPAEVLELVLRPA